MDPLPSNDPRVYMAAERTFLAWIRTGVALMGFGFVVARFGLFLRELTAEGADLVQPRHALSLPIGISLILVGILVTGASALRHRSYVQALRQGESPSYDHSQLPVLLALLLVVLGGIMAAYLAFL